MADPAQDATIILQELTGGDSDAAQRLFPIVYEDLRALAGSFFRGQRVGHTLEPTALVHESFLRLIGGAGIEWESRAHFLAVAGKAMRYVLADYARRVAAEKRGGGWARVTLTGAVPRGRPSLIRSS